MKKPICLCEPPSGIDPGGIDPECPIHGDGELAEINKELQGLSWDPPLPGYTTRLAPVYLAEQIFFHVLLHGGEGNPFKAMSSKWFVDLVAPKIRELLTSPRVHTAEDIERIGKNATKNGPAITRNPQRF